MPRSSRPTRYFDVFFQGEATDVTPPAAINGGVLSVPAGSTSYFQVDLAAGRYVLVSEDGEVEDDPSPLHVDFQVT